MNGAFSPHAAHTQLRRSRTICFQLLDHLFGGEVCCIEDYPRRGAGTIGARFALRVATVAQLLIREAPLRPWCVLPFRREFGGAAFGSNALRRR